ncbi:MULTISPECIES: nucleotidyltransferase domain-containing protein [Mycolicibacter]|uniref:Uncharacterized protein n=1 Tax=Mycolicibacter longobardus TaxID=1108812 RepID=A0A1X1YBR1_9MYCO|nr:MULTISPECIES: nucleotidyltransferase domain-containing protein [Mycolicibacter]ORW08538.1 hypothetical protein AWC16_19260 [Mycolicibacter longobardus]RAV04351.1 nucleotidyltransferase domain-containing protein [Mycolicibacter senuensis]
MQLNRPFASVTPTLDGDVLAVLAAVSGEAFTISQIRRIVATASGEGIRKVLARLVAQGVVLQSQVGRTNTYLFNSEHLAAEPILALTRLASTLLERIAEHLGQWQEPPIYAAVFGSAATGRMSLDSDIDQFLVRGRPAKSARPQDDSDVWDQQVSDLTRAVSLWTGNDARAVVYTEADLRTAIAAGEPLIRDVAGQGLTVRGERSWLTRQLRPAQTSAKPKRSV